jgi:hypothetical protein
MAYADTKAAIIVHALAAGAALSDPILDVAAGFPVPRGRCVRVYWAGETEPVRMGGQRVLNAELIAERTRIVLFLPITLNDETLAAVIDAQLHAFKHDLRTRVLGDSQLGGQSTDLEFEYAEPDLVVFNNARFAVLVMDIVSDFTEYAIAP